MFDDVSYAVRFENGLYYTGFEYNPTEIPESTEIEKACLYSMDWQIPKDIYLSAYIRGKNRTYDVIKVKVKKIYEILES